MTKTWDEVWQGYKGPRLPFDRLKQNQTKTCQRIVNQIGLAKDSKIIDVGCGTWLACRGLLQGSKRRIDNQVPWYIIGDKSDEGLDASLRVELGNPSLERMSQLTK
jgi:hypothetical protein